MVPLVMLLELAIVVTAPLTLLAAAVITLVARSSRPVRTVAITVTFAAVELRTLARIRRGVEDWNQLVREVLGTGYEAMNRILDIDVSLEAGSPGATDLTDTDGVIVLARHCGPGDTIFIAWLLAVYYNLTLRIVLKDALRWEPTIDIAGSHLPFFFVRRGDDRSLDGVRSLAAGLGAGESLLLFPEGGNFTWPRWQAAIKRLVAAGEYARARVARRQTHTLPARPGGAVAALGAAPDADVLLLAHSGLNGDGRNRPWWRAPVHADFVIRTVLIPAAAVPRDEDAAREFLDTAWSQVDTWVEGHVALVEFAEHQHR
jgi:1-acyl-sn-glycerol-3-phosphate acyltransferase